MSGNQMVVEGARWLRVKSRRSSERLTETFGGPARRKAIMLLAAVLSLSAADVGAISALAPQLEAAFRVGNAGIGVLVTVSSLVGALTTLPIGVLADRFSRTRILSVSILGWGAVEFGSSFASSFAILVATRLALGAVTATAGPTVASLTGDLFPARERGRIYGLILTGELIGAGIGVVAAGDIGAAVSWRVGLGILAIPSVVLAWMIHRYFPEPARGGQSHLTEGAEEILSAEEVEAHPEAYQAPADGEDGAGAGEEQPVLAAVNERHIEPERSLILDTRAELTMWRAVRWVFRVRTNVALILASCFGYFFLGGMRTFALIYTRAGLASDRARPLCFSSCSEGRPWPP
jgi:MFS family permease